MFPEFTKQLPVVDIPLDQAKGRLLQAGDHQVVFWEIDPGRFPTHTHGAQYSVILDGKATLCIGEERRDLKKGDEFFIPADVEHSIEIHSKLRAIDVFAEPDRFKPRV